jgi:hypothetical protein
MLADLLARKSGPARMAKILGRREAADSVNTLNQPRSIARAGLAFGLTFIFSAASAERAPTSLPLESGQLRGAQWLRFDTDACGSVERAEGPRPLIKQSSAQDDSDDDDGDWANGWGMSDEDSAILEQWVTRHPDVAIVTDAVQKSCDGDGFDRYDVDPSGVA